jgi:hypothetical protein
MEHEYELKTSKGRVVWAGADGPTACKRWEAEHPGEYVIAWRNYPRVGVFLVHPSQIVG